VKTLNKVKENLLKKITHAKKRVKSYKESHGEKPSETHTYHGGWDLGYWEGKLSAYQAILDEIIESEQVDGN
jgi:hypothetical protein